MNRTRQLLIPILTLLCCCTGAWAENDWDIQESTSGNVTTFTIIRTNTAAAETVKYRLVNLSAYAGEHYNVTQVNGQNSSALSGDLTFSAGDGSKTVQVTESEASTNAYKYQNGTTRQYRFEVTDQGGFELEHHDRTITTGISVPSSDVFAIKDVTIKSDEITVTDGGFGQAYHSMTVSDYFDNAAPRTYLQHIGAELRMTLSFQGREVEDGWQYVQIYANESTSNIDTGAKDGNPGACTYSKYTAAFEILDGEKDANYKSYTFPVTSVDENVKVINPWGHGSLYNLDMQKFNNSRASDGRLIIPTNLLSLYIRFNAYGSDNDDWIAKNTIAHIQAMDGTAPSIQAASADPGYHATGNTVYVSVAFNEIVKVTGTPTLNTSNWGSLNYVSGDGTNVLTFSGVIPENASDNLDITEISGTVKDLAGNDFTGSSVTPSDPYTGSFTIDANGTKVLFSKGNLQYVNGNWQFAEHQYDYFGAAQSDNHKDLFGYNGYSTPDASWFNMSHDQWKYIFTTRSVTNTLSDGARYTMATLGSTYKGLIIFPDDYTHPDGTDFVAGTYNGYSNFTATVSLAGWALMEAAGCVFLPAAGYKAYNYSTPADYGVEVCFNTATTSSSGRYYTPSFRNSKAGLDDDSNINSWTSVRLVKLIANAVTLTEGDDLSALSAYVGKTCKVAYSRTFTEGKSSTVCLPFAYTKKEGDGSFYTFTGITHEGSNYEATMTEYTGATLEANTPYLFTPSATSDVDFSGTYTLPASITAGSTTSGDWTYLGTYETISWPEAPTGIYGFSAQAVGDIQQGEFVKVGAYVRIKPMRCYLKYKNGSANYAGARGMTRAAGEELPETIKVRLISADGEVTGIGSLQTKTGEVTFDKDAWYSLDGRRIEGKPSAKGIYVNNGKKVIIK